MRIVRHAVLTVAAIWSAVALFSMSGCYSSMGRDLTPAQEDLASTPSQLSGSYCFTSIESALRTENTSGHFMKTLPVPDLANGSTVDVALARDQLTMRYRDARGVPHQVVYRLERSEPGLAQVRIVLPSPRSGAALGLGWNARSATISKLGDGRLVITESFVEKGLACGLMPFQERWQRQLTLEPAC